MKNSIAKKIIISCFIALMIWGHHPCLERSYAFSNVVIFKQFIPEEILTVRKGETDRVLTTSTFEAPILNNKYKIMFPHLFFNGPDIERAQQIVSENLGASGIVKTLEKIMCELPHLPYWKNGKANRELLEEIGIPIRLLACYCCEKPKITGLDQIISTLQHNSLSHNVSHNINWTFDYVPSLPGFKLLPENGLGKIVAFRLQIPSIHYPKGQGDGCALDIARQLLLTTRDETCLISLTPDNIAPFAEMISEWHVYKPERIIMLEDDTISSQWAQDNCKPGALFNQQGKFVEYVTLVPRFATAGEEYRPSESFIFDQVQGAGWKVIQSPLLFQGGNIIPVKNPKTDELIVFIGQAEVLRNKTLGLSEEEVLQAFRKEWGAERIEVIPSCSFHIDLEVSFRWHDERMIAYMNDSLSAARLVAKCGIKKLMDFNIFSSQEVQELRYWLEHSLHEDQMLQIVWSKVHEFFLGKHTFFTDMADSFTVSSEESGELNFSRFLLALDIVSAFHKDREEFWRTLKDHYSGDTLFDYYTGLLEKEQIRIAMRSQLLSCGIEVVPLPSISYEETSLNYINGVHDLDALYMPAFGGLFQDLDEKVAEIIKHSLGNKVNVYPIRNSQTQSDCGGIHCSVSTYVW
ncbi:MAG: hypothetical protein ACMUIP_06245 [bacterium]